MKSWSYLQCEMDGISVINTHTHQRDASYFGEYNLDVILKNSYVNWSKVDFGHTIMSRRYFLNKVEFRHDFKALQSALATLYNLPERLTSENWDNFNAVIAMENSSRSILDNLKERCHYDKMILDAYWDSGNDHNRPDIFTPAFRIDIFIKGYDRSFINHDGIQISSYMPDLITGIDEYVSVLRAIIMQKKQMGCVALKSANAYERGLDYFFATKESAQNALRMSEDIISLADKLSFESYIFHCLCDIAAELTLPFQIHTGLGLLWKTGAMQLYEAICNHPKTKFVLLHCGYPWTGDVAGLCHYFPNVYPDLCWLPTVSPTAAEHIFQQLLEIGAVDRICWGCDTWTMEESYGALQSAKNILAEVMSTKIDVGYFTPNEAVQIIRDILYSNAKRLYYHDL